MPFPLRRHFTKHRLILAAGTACVLSCLAWLLIRMAPYGLPPTIKHHGLSREEVASVKAAVTSGYPDVFSALPIDSARELLHVLQRAPATTNRVEIFGDSSNTHYTIIALKEGGNGRIGRQQTTFQAIVGPDGKWFVRQQSLRGVMF